MTYEEWVHLKETNIEWFEWTRSFMDFSQYRKAKIDRDENIAELLYCPEAYFYWKFYTVTAAIESGKWKQDFFDLIDDRMKKHNNYNLIGLLIAKQNYTILRQMKCDKTLTDEDNCSLFEQSFWHCVYCRDDIDWSNEFVPNFVKNARMFDTKLARTTFKTKYGFQNQKNIPTIMKKYLEYYPLAIDEESNEI